MVTSAIIWHNTIKTTRSNKSFAPNLEYTIFKTSFLFLLFSVWSYIIHIFYIYHMVTYAFVQDNGIILFNKNYATLRRRRSI